MDVFTLLIERCWSVLVKPLGPVQLKVTCPGVEVVASRINVLPKHKGLIPLTTGVAGGFGSAKINGPTLLEGQLKSVTKTLL